MSLPLVCARDVPPEPVAWLWQDRIPRGALTILEGDPGCGKSTLLYDLAARVSTGREMPGGSERAAPAAALLVSDEDSPATICQTLNAAGADLDRIGLYNKMATESVSFTLPSQIESLESNIGQSNVRLVVLDPVTAFLEGNVHHDQSVRRALGPLAAVAQRTGAAIVLVRHLRKGAGGSALYRGAGSIGLIAAARSGLLVAGHPVNEDRRLVAQFKSSLGPLATSWSFRLVAEDDGLIVEWQGPSNFTAQQISAYGKPDEDSALGEAAHVLYSLLAEGPLPANRVKKLAARSGIADRTLRRARKLLGVLSQRVGFGKDSWFYWKLPADHELITQLRARDLDELADKLFHGRPTLPTDTARDDGPAPPDKKTEDDEPPLEV